jgi:nitrate reductase beta subunit
MNIIKRYLEKKAAERALEVEMQKRAQEAQLAQIKRDLARNEAIMFSMWCPVAATNCNNDCIHFTPGRGGMFKGIGEGRFYQHNPSCKLWRQ